MKIKLKKIKHAKSGEYSIIDLTEEGPIKIRVNKLNHHTKETEVSEPIEILDETTACNKEMEVDTNLSENLTSNTNKLDLSCEIATNEMIIVKLCSMSKAKQ